MKRRNFVQASLALGSLTSLSLVGCATTAPIPAKAKVVVIGGGYGGATAAKYVRMLSNYQIDVVLVEPNDAFISCPISNLVIGGSKTMGDITTPYDKLRSNHGVIHARDLASKIDPSKKTVTLAGGATIAYDKLIVSPGIDMMWNSVEGLKEASAAGQILQAWKAGPETVALRKQLEAMPDGGVYVLSIPRSPYRCPPGPYERVCQVAHYFKTYKPKSKIVVLDANADIQSKKGLFLKEWNGQYKGMIDYQPNMQVTEVDARNRVAITDLGDKVKASVLNVVPPHGAAEIARKTGLVNANDRWCTVDWITLESTAAKGIHVLGDATLPGPAMPKSGHMANQHGKAAAATIVEILNGRTPEPQMMANTCYSFVDDKRVIHVASVHRWSPEKKTLEPVQGAGGVSAEASLLEGNYANAWARNIWNDMLT